MLATLLVQLVYWLRISPELLPDAPRYIHIAQAILDFDYQHALHFHYPPLFPACIALLLPWIDSPQTACRVAELIITMLTVLPIYILARQVFGRSTAEIAALIFPFKFFYLPLGGHAEPLLLLLLFSALGSGLYSIRIKSAKHALLTGLLFGLGSLAKPEAQAYFMLWFAIFMALLVYTRYPLRSMAKLGLACWAGYLLILSPYLGAYYKESGRFTLNPKTPSLLMLHNEPDWAQVSYGLRRDELGLYTNRQRIVALGDRTGPPINLVEYIADNRKRLALTYIDRLGFTITKVIPTYLEILTPPYALIAGLLILIGLIRPGWTKTQAWSALYLMSFGLVTLLTVPLFRPEMRFFSCWIPLLVILLARGADQVNTYVIKLLRRNSAANTKNGFTAIVQAVLVLLIVTPDLYALSRLPRQIKFHQMVEDRQVVADWLAANLSAGRNFMSSGTYMPLWYLAGLEPEDDIVLPLAALDQVLEYATQEDVEYIVLSENDVFRRHINLVALLDDGYSQQDLKLAHKWKSPHGREYVIYRFEPGVSTIP